MAVSPPRFQPQVLSVNREVVMRRTSLSGLAALIAISLSCGDGSGVETDDLIGTWDATKLAFTNPANPAEHVDLILEGWAYTLTLHADGTYHGTLDDPESPPEAVSGVWEASIDVFRMKDDTEPWWQEFDMSRNGNTLTLTGGDVNFDFGEGDISAKLDVVLLKR
jgi:hypothetical protein